MWSCMPTRPGMTLRPARSSTFAPSGIFVVPESPIATIFPSAMISSLIRTRGRACAIHHTHMGQSEDRCVFFHENGHGGR